VSGPRFLVCSVISNCTGRPVFFWTMDAARLHLAAGGDVLDFPLAVSLISCRAFSIELYRMRQCPISSDNCHFGQSQQLVKHSA